MKALTSNVSKALPIGATLQCVDNTVHVKSKLYL